MQLLTLDTVPAPSLTKRLLPPVSCQVFALTESELTAIVSPDAPRVSVVPVEGSIFDDLNFAIAYSPYIFIVPVIVPAFVTKVTAFIADVVLRYPCVY